MAPPTRFAPSGGRTFGAADHAADDQRRPQQGISDGGSASHPPRRVSDRRHAGRATRREHANNIARARFATVVSRLIWAGPHDIFCTVVPIPTAEMPTDPTTPSPPPRCELRRVSRAPTKPSSRPSPARIRTSATVPLARRDFLKVAGASAGAFLVGGANLGKAEGHAGTARAVRAIGRVAGHRRRRRRRHGAAGRRSTCARWARRSRSSTRTAPGNARSTSGDETRGVRSSYGDRPGELGEVWMLWAREAMKKWIAFDDEWGRELRLNLFHVTGDLIMRTEWDNFQLRLQGLVGQEQDPVSGPQSGRRPQSRSR